MWTRGVSTWPVLPGRLYSRLSKFHEIWVITEEHAFKEKIEQYLDSGDNELESVHFQIHT